MSGMAAFEAPRKPQPRRRTRTIRLIRSGQIATTVHIPDDGIAYDLILYQSKVYIRRKPDLYGEATMWPIVSELDADT